MGFGKLVMVRSRNPMGHNESATPEERLHPRMPRYVYATRVAYAEEGYFSKRK